MYVLSSLPCTPTELERLFCWVWDMLNRAVICLTAFLASTGLVSQHAALSATSANAEYLLGLGKAILR